MSQRVCREEHVHPLSKSLVRFGARPISRLCIFRGRIWKGDIMVADIEELEEMDASELHAPRFNAKEVLTPQRSGNFIFLGADGTVKIFGGRNEKFSNSSSGLCGSYKWFLIHFRKLHIPPSRWTQSQTVRAEKRIISYSVEVHRRYQNNIYITWRIVGEKHWRLPERRWRERIVRCMDRLHKIHFIERKATWRLYMVGEETCEETNNLKTRQCVARYVEACVWRSERESKTKMSYRETKARQCQTIERNILHWTKRRRIQAYNESRSEKVGSSDASSNALQNTDKEQWVNPPKYWETQDEIRLYCPCRRKHETKARRGWTQTSSRSHYCKRDGFYDSLQSRSQIHSDASSNENSKCKGSSGKKMEKLEKIPTWQLT